MKIPVGRDQLTDTEGGRETGRKKEKQIYRDNRKSWKKKKTSKTKQKQTNQTKQRKRKEKKKTKLKIEKISI